MPHCAALISSRPTGVRNIAIPFLTFRNYIPMRFSVSEYVRWEDIDAAGIINYQAYLRFFGLAEVELFRSCGLPYRTLFDELGLWLPRVHVECDFFHPVTLDELLIVDAYFGKIGA